MPQIHSCAATRDRPGTCNIRWLVFHKEKVGFSGDRLRISHILVAKGTTCWLLLRKSIKTSASVKKNKKKRTQDRATKLWHFQNIFLRNGLERGKGGRGEEGKGEMKLGEGRRKRERDLLLPSSYMPRRFVIICTHTRRSIVG